MNGKVFSKLIFQYYGIELSAKQKTWFAGDGKELRGTILKGHTRGESIVQFVRHADRSVLCEGFFTGRKESEVPALRDLLQDEGVAGQKFTMDALHFKPKTLREIVCAGGQFVVHLKNNQKELYQEMVFCSTSRSPVYEQNLQEKGHGRLERRHYRTYKVDGLYIDERWDDIKFQTLIVVERQREIVNTGQYSSQTDYYLSNIPTKNMQTAEELFAAIRNHWQVEVNNHLRDCTLKEDATRCTDVGTARIMASSRTLVIKILQKSEAKNKRALLDNFADNFDQCIQWLKKINFL